jgi:hypothetical protein
MLYRRNQRVVTAALLAALALPSGGAEDPAPRPKLPPAVEKVYGLAMAAPPEFGARALLRVESKVADRELRQDLIEMAFRLGGAAQIPVRMELLPGVDADSRSGSLAGAMNLHLDRLYLQSRSVLAMLQIDPHRGRELFTAMSHPELAVSQCSDTMVPDPSPYYEALGAVIRLGFSIKERNQESHVGFAVAQISRLSSVREIEPAARMIAATGWNRVQLELVASALSTKLESIAPDSRAFFASAPAIDAAIANVAARLRQNGSVTEPLAASYRNFLVAQLRAQRCADLGQPTGRISQPGQRMELFGADIRGDLPALLTEEMTPKLLEGEMEIDRYWQSDTARRIFQQCLQLRQGPGGGNYSDAARRTREWSRQLTDFLNTLDGWSPSEEASDTDYFHEKAIVYEALLELAPPGDLSDRVLDGFMTFLKSSSLSTGRPVEWYWHVRSTLNRVGASSPQTAGKLAAAYRASGNMVLSLDAALDEAAPENPWFDHTAAAGAPVR